MAGHQTWKARGIKSMYTNADQLWNKMNELREITKKEWPDLIGINEVKYKNMEGKELKTKQFELDKEKYDIFGNNIEEDTGRGQVMHVDKKLKADRIELKTKVTEAIAVTIETSKKEVLIVALIYRSPSSTQKDNRRIRKVIDELAGMNSRELVIMGDFNYKEINWEENTVKGDEQTMFMECIQQNFLNQHVGELTRFRGNDIPSRVDLIFTKEEDTIDEIEYNSPLGLSDHKVIVFNIKANIEREIKIESKKMYKKANIQGMMEDIKEIDWEETLNTEENSMEGIIDICNKRFNEVMDKHIPTTKVNNSQGMRPPLDETMRKLLQEKDKTARIASERKKTNNRYEIEKARTAYNRARNKVRGYSRKLRKDYEQGIASRAKKGNNKEAFAYMNSKKGKTRIGKICMDPEDKASQKTDNDKEKAQIFSKFFISVQTTEPDGEIPEMEMRDIKIPMNNITVDEEKVKKLLEDLNKDKSAGPDISPKVLQPLAEVICKPLTIIFRESLKRRIVPKQWKIAWITVIFKQGSKVIAGNYRPVSLTSIILKMLEKIVRDHIVEHMTKNDLFSKKQYGFIKGRSTVLQLLCALEQWTENIEEGKTVDCIYADFKKAFDKVPHKRLMKKVRAYGIHENICQWIEDFLKDRKQRVTVNGEVSDWETVISGIPQGTVIGPILFVIYINDLPDLIASTIFLFADDSKIWRGIKDAKDIEILQADLQKMKEWSIKWLLEFHPDKLKHLHIARDNEDPDYTYYIGEDKAKTTYMEKDLGVTVDAHLSFEDHMNKRVKTANSMMGMIRRGFQFLDRTMFLPLYKGMVRSGIEYGGPVWSPYKMKDIEKVEGVQRRATKVLPGMKEMAYEDRLRKLKLPTLRHRRIRGDMIETYKIIHKLYDPKVTPTIRLKRDMGRGGGSRGHALEIFQPRARLESSRNIFTNRIWKVWNSLTTHIVTAPTVDTFKARLDKWWEGNPAIYDYRLAVVS